MFKVILIAMLLLLEVDRLVRLCLCRLEICLTPQLSTFFLESQWLVPQARSEEAFRLERGSILAAGILEGINEQPGRLIHRTQEF